MSSVTAMRMAVYVFDYRNVHLEHRVAEVKTAGKTMPREIGRNCLLHFSPLSKQAERFRCLSVGTGFRCVMSSVILDPPTWHVALLAPPSCFPSRIASCQ